MSDAARVRLAVTARRDAGDVAFEVALENASDAAWETTLRTSQRFDASATDADGREVYRFTEGRMFLQVLTPLTVPPGERVSLGEDRFPAPAGPVTLTVWLPGVTPRVEATVTP